MTACGAHARMHRPPFITGGDSFGGKAAPGSAGGGSSNAAAEIVILLLFVVCVRARAQLNDHKPD